MKTLVEEPLQERLQARAGPTGSGWTRALRKTRQIECPAGAGRRNGAQGDAAGNAGKDVDFFT